MECKTNNSAVWRFTRRFIVLSLLYAVFSVLSTYGLLLWRPTSIAIWLLAVLPAIPIAMAVLLTGRYISEEKDDFQRAVLVQSLLGGIGATLVVTTAWGFLENYAHFQRLNILMLWPLYLVLVGISYGLVKARYR
jgi:predicted RND superfamily exporter protein